MTPATPLPETETVQTPGSGRVTITIRSARKFAKWVTPSPLAGKPDGRTTSIVCRHCTDAENSTLSTDASMGTRKSCGPGVSDPGSLKIVWRCDPNAVRSAVASAISSGESRSRWPPVPSATWKYDGSSRPPHGQLPREADCCCCSTAANNSGTATPIANANDFTPYLSDGGPRI